MKKILLLALLLFGSTVNAAIHTASVCPENSGSWYDPRLAGEGMTIQQIGPDKLVFYRYHAWPIFDFKTGDKVATAGGYASGILTRGGDTWNGIITAYKGSEGPLLWRDALIGLSTVQQEVAGEILNQPVIYKVSDLHLDKSNGSVHISVVSPHSAIPDQDTHFQLDRLITPDCREGGSAQPVAFKSARIPVDEDFAGDIQLLRQAINRMVKNIIYVLSF